MLNEMMANTILRQIVRPNPNSQFFTIKAVECSNKEQLVIFLRWVDDDMLPHEEFIRLHDI